MFREGPEPEREVMPDALGATHREHLQNAESDCRDVDEAFVGFELASDLAAILLPRPVQELVAGSTADLRHRLEPEVIAEATEGLDQRLEGDLDLEAEPVDIEDGFGAEHSVGGEEDALGAVGVDAEHEADEKAVPEQIAAEVSDVLEVAVEFDRGRAEAIGTVEEFPELDASAPGSGAARALRAPSGRREFVGHGVGAHPADEVKVGSEESAHEAFGGVVGISDDDAASGDQLGDEHMRLVDEGGLLGRGSLQAILDLKPQRNGEDVRSGLDKGTHGAPEVAHDVPGLGVVGGLLVQELDGGHLAAGLGGLDAVDDEEREPGNANGLRALLDDLGPAGAECLDVEGAGVEEVEEIEVLGWGEPQAADEAGDAEGL